MATLHVMTDEFQDSDHLYYALEGLTPWLDVTMKARDGFSSAAAVGQILSQVLNATDEGSTIIALTGDLTDEGGYLLVVSTTGLVLVDVESLAQNSPRFTVSLHTFAEVTKLEVSGFHDYFQGTERAPRHKNLRFTVELNGKRIEFPGRVARQAKFLTPDATRAAFQAVRDGR